MKIFIKILITFIIVSFKLNTVVYALNGPAVEYKITMTYLEMCETGSTASSCVNPVVLGSGDSGLIDIANTAAGAEAAQYGDTTKLKKGTVYTWIQVTLKREATIKGVVNGCYTTASEVSDATNTAKGSTNVADYGATTVHLAMVGSGNGNNNNSSANSDGSGAADPDIVTSGHEYLQWRGELTNPIVVTTRLPKVEIAFGTDTALGLVRDCSSSSTGLYASEPNVTISFQ